MSASKVNAHPKTGEQSSGRGVFTDAKGINGLKVIDLPPFQKTVGPHEIVLHMSYSCLNHRDEFTIMANAGYTPCSDGVGRVAEVGKEVTRVAVGDRVCPIFTQNWLSESQSAGTWPLGSPGLPGTACQKMLLHEDNVVKVPEHLTDAEASTLPCAGVTAWNGLITEGRAQPGETLLVQGTGGVSIFGLQFAHAMGMKVICTSSSNEKLDRARGLGANNVINYKETPEWSKVAKQMGGADHILEIGGAGTLQQALKALRPHGSIAVIGLLAGVKTELNIVSFFSNRVRMNGITVGTRENFEEMNTFIAKHKLRPVVGAEFPLDNVQAAFDLMHRGGHFGNIVLKIPPVAGASRL
eukprot:gnl/TRDRNA2_/TRDRNA2_166286_c0_seq1.p1 gnl/TRDRNA2_/TRDRNA2_166286_c0~~gnl/TRDRNA2_/TRDRNA2_166286_c0_seq1.p1  ORF type:complete len:354 (-),score=59.93 gnl/TRDRNA2_/TRDRNA2_166286_c0_seq1:216-1277(-)